MIKIWTILRIILWFIVIWIPALLIIFLASKKIMKTWWFLEQKINELKTLKKIKKEILEKTVEKKEDWESELDVEEKDEITQLLNKNLNKQEIENIQNIKKENNEQNEIINSKQKKLLERITYEASLLKKDGKIDDYEKKLIEWLAIDPNNLEIKKHLAELYFTIWDHKKALSLSKKIIEEDPEDHNAIRQIWEIYLLTWDLKTAEVLVEKAINLKPTNPKYYISMVEIFYNTERKKEAIDCMEKIVKLRPTNTNYIMTLAWLYEEIDDKDNAKKYYFKILELEPSNEKAKRKIKNY